MSVGSLLREGTLPGTSGYRRAIRVGIGDHDAPESVIRIERKERSRSAGTSDQDESEPAVAARSPDPTLRDWAKRRVATVKPRVTANAAEPVDYKRTPSSSRRSSHGPPSTSRGLLPPGRPAAGRAPAPHDLPSP